MPKKPTQQSKPRKAHKTHVNNKKPKVSAKPCKICGSIHKKYALHCSGAY